MAPYAYLSTEQQEIRDTPAVKTDILKMFKQRYATSKVSATFEIFELIFHSTAHSVRSTQKNAIVALLISILQTVLMLGAFYLFMSFSGLKNSKLRGDMILYLISGMFIYMTHIKTVNSIMGSASPTSAMQKHSPMSPAVTISSSALSSLYLRILTILAILFFYHALVGPFEIFNVQAVFGMFVLSWFFGISVGLLFMSLMPWFPRAVPLLKNVYIRINMIASGKLFVANNLPSFMRDLFDWNPLFHIIDQCRGFMFVNYLPRYTNWEYAFWVAISLMTIGFMAEFFTRRRASLSWGA